MMSSLGNNFNEIVGNGGSECFETTHKRARKNPATFSLRPSFEVWQILEKTARSEPLGRHTRRQLLEEENPTRRRLKGTPVEDYVALARVLSTIGE